VARYEFPASSEQRRMWVLDQLDPGRATYNVPWAVWLDGPLDEAALAGAWAASVARHEALRTVFRDDGGVPVQVVDDEGGGTALPVVPLDGGPDHDREDRARQVLRDFASAPFDLARGPLIRVHLVRLAPGRHVLSLVAHHIVADGWSFRLLFSELAAGYEALRAGRPPTSPTPGLQYADFALWQVEHGDAGGYADAEAFWRAELDGAPLELALPADHPYPDRERDAAATVDASVDAPTAAALRRLARDREATLFAVVAAGYAALLSRLTGADDLLVAVPVAARTRAETEPVVGLFVNTVAIRADLRGNPTLGQLVGRLHAANARAQPHQELPFARVVELSRPERLLSRSPLVQVMCVVEDAWPVLDRGGLRWRPELTDNGTGKFELELTMADGPAGLDGRLRYRTDLFDPQTARRLAGGLRMVLTAMAAVPSTPVSEVDILPPDVRELVTRTWPEGLPAAGPVSPAPPSPVTLAAAACTGDRVVIRGSDGEFTGAQLRGRAEAIAWGLSALGVRVQDTVGILLPRGARPLAALLGVWWLGAAYVPIDPAQPPLRIRGMLADAGVRVLVSDRAALGPLLSELGGAVPVLDLAGRPETPADGPVAPREVPQAAAANVLFTSGSTGRPKAVTITHGSLAHHLRAFREMVPLDPSDRVAAVTSFGFDISILDLLLPLLAGAQVIVADADQARDGGLLRRMLTATGATVLQATPATWRMLTDSGGVPERVRLRLCGGEALPRDLADALLRGPDTRLWNLYGPTETTVWSAAAPVPPGSGPVDVGTAVVGSRIYVLDRWANPVAPGVTGEVYIGGAGVGRGYVGAPGLTAGCFVPDPFDGRPGARLYRTGDLGRWRPSGRLEILGRADRQMKIRGFRVEAGEIEAALRTHPDVADAVVTSVAGQRPGDVRLAAYVVTGGPDPSATLREHMRHMLPDYMVPWVFVPLAALPRTPSGKVDHRALPEPRPDAAPDEPRVAPRTRLEAELADLVAAVLRRSEPVGALDNFFVLGGHSLTATQLMAEIWTAYGVDLPVRTLFDDPTVAGLAAAVTMASAGSAGASSPDLGDFLDTLSDQDIDDLLQP
jgi:amino acid adenylation domain-containing protein